MTGNGRFGVWIEDKYGLPAYNYNCNQNSDTYAKTSTTYGYSTDHFHQIGNDRITAIANNGGYIQVLESSRGFQWLTSYNKKRRKIGGGIAFFNIGNSDYFYSDLFHKELFDKNSIFERIFGIGYFKKKIQTNKLKLIHNICVPFSDDPILISEIFISNISNSINLNNVKIINFWDIYLHHLLRSLIVTSNNRKKFGKNKFVNLFGKLIKLCQKITRTDTDGARKKFDNKFKFNISFNFKTQSIYVNPKYKNKPPNKPEEPAKHNFYPKTIFLSMIEGNATKAFYKSLKLKKDNQISIDFKNSDFPNDYSLNNYKKYPSLGIGTEFQLKPQETRRITCIFGYCEKEEIDHLIEKYKKIVSENSILKWNAEKWKSSLIELRCENDPWLARETKWHSYYTRSACCFDEYFNLHKFPQGSIYLFGHGLDGAIRDFMLYLNSIIFINPQLAREYLIYVNSLMEPNGKLPYSIYGFAKVYTKSVHSKPSDLNIFLLWGILEYIYTTRDFNFLEEKIPFYPKNLNLDSTILERIFISLKYLFSDKVGIGEHGLIKVGDGDWSDGISLFVESRKKFIKNGESNFNTAFTIYILQKLIPLLEKYNSDLASLYAEKLIKLKEAILKTWNGKWFYRGWDGKGNPIGDKNIYLEHHNWILISKILEDDRAHSLINEILTKLDEPSHIGQYISYPPEKTLLNILPKGWDVNGGIWHAMNSLLTWGYSKYDSKKAYNSLIKNSLAHRANVYPNIWYGIWSGPDAYIADYAENAGQAFYHLITPMCDFPIMNLNIHACYLLSVIKIVGIEAEYNSLIIHPKLEFQNFQFKSPIISIEFSSNFINVELNLEFTKNLKVKICKPKWWEDSSIILFNGINITKNKDLSRIEENFIIISIKENIKKININLK
ncbi:MAG: GH36-type glycosyl hydrolase domain-containing protein [Candidatus Hermodarchaeota archaeon]